MMAVLQDLYWNLHSLGRVHDQLRGVHVNSQLLLLLLLLLLQLILLLLLLYFDQFLFL